MNNKTTNKVDECTTDIQITASDTVTANKASSVAKELNTTDTTSCMNCGVITEWQPWSGSNKCPKCGSNHIEVNTMVVLTTYPAQAQLRCKDCGYLFGSGILATNTEGTSDATYKRWQHDQSILNTPKVGDWPPAPQVGDWPIEPPESPDDTSYKKSSFGWICSKCGRSLAPHINSCPYCSRPNTLNITY